MHHSCPFAAQIVRVVVAGGLLHTNSHLSQPTAYSSVRQQTAAIGPVRSAAPTARARCCAALPLLRFPLLRHRALRAVRQSPSLSAFFVARCCWPTRPAHPAAALACRDVDMCLTELAGSVPVDVMPGAGDPANYSLPQQPLHPCLFPGAAAFPSLQRATNPHAFAVDGVSFLGTSGQNVDDVYRWGGRGGGDGGRERAG